MTVAADPTELLLAEIPNLRRVARGLVRGRAADEDDLVQATLLRAYRNLAQFQPGTSMGAWAATILRHEFLRSVERKKLVQFVPDQEFEQRRSRLRSSTEFDFAPILETCEDSVRAALLGLPEHYFMPFWLVSVMEYTYEEVAAKLGIPEGTVMSRIFRARRLLRSAIEMRRTKELVV